jgi:2-polyprenyl-3-methyl-5-hydroxy-6-metoxy-1,4-benzoquinol methylase/methyltransferase-like protein
MSAQAAASASDVLLASYEAVPYGGGAIHATRPDYLAAMARLHGLHTPDVRHCRVLDIGCATGGNLLSMAVSMPDSTFVGIDLSPRQISRAREAARSLGVENIRFEAMSVTELGTELGAFDYIVCHGVYSWVPTDVQRAILDVCARHLTPDGLAYVSYNTYPGWHIRGLVRDMLLFHDLAELNPAERVKRGRELLTTISEAVPKMEGVYATLLREELDLLSETSDTYFLHEELESENHPVYFADFARSADSVGLQYVCEANLSLLDTQFSADNRQKFRSWSADRIQYNQYLDFARNRTFRRSILCHASRAVLPEVSSDALPALWLRGRCFADPEAPEAKTSGVEVFRTSDGVAVTMDNPMVRAALHILSDSRPASVPFPEVLSETRRRLASGPDVTMEMLADAMLRCALVRLVDLTTMPAPCTATISRCPVASPLARYEARDTADVSSLSHLTMSLAPFDRFVIRLLDGTRDADAVTGEVLNAVRFGTLTLGESPTRETIAEAVNFALQQFKLTGLLVQ